MQCPYCNHREDRVVDSREGKEGLVVRRRRECLACHRRFTTYERMESVPLMVIKKGGRREAFDRSKILKGLLRACEKRPVRPQQMEEILEEVEGRLMQTRDLEMSSREIGKAVMAGLKRIDKVAYVRFASVYREFKDVKEFMSEIHELFGKEKES